MTKCKEANPDRERLIADFLASCSNALLKTYAPRLVSVFGLDVNALTLAKWFAVRRFSANPLNS